MDPTQLGMNRTGIQMSPLTSNALIEAALETEPTSEGDAQSLLQLREPYLLEADPVGSVPIPGTLTGAARAGVKLMQGERLHALIDRLGERLAFERGGVRLYEALIGKCETRTDEAVEIDVAVLRRFRDDEAEHFRLVSAAMEELGGDPTAQTPCADVSGVAAMGLMQVALDPRTSVLQTLHAVLGAELIDGADWELLVQLTRDQGYDDIAERFARAAQEEAVHLEQIHEWYATASANSMRRSVQ